MSRLCLLICIYLVTLWQAPGFAKPVGEPHVYKTVGGRDLTLYVTKPAGWAATDSRPAIVFFHGGGWTGGSPGQFTEHSKYLATRGMVAIQVEYRLLDRKGKEPPVTCCRDAKSALRWVRSHATNFGIDPQRIASAGGSAGGHLASFVAMVEGTDDPADDLSVSPKSNAQILFNAVFDNGPAGWGHARVGDRYREFSPFHNVSSDDPPALVLLGSADKLIPVKTAHDFQAAMKKVNVECDVIIYADQPHGFFNFGRNGNQYYFQTVTAMDRFLAKLGWLEGEPTLAAPK